MTAPTRVTVLAGAATILVALSLSPVYATSTWFWHSLGAAIVIGLVGAGLRRTSAPHLVVILVQLLAVFFYLGWIYSDDMIWGLLPGPAAVQDLASLLSTGLADADTYAPKVPETRGLLLLTSGGVALVNLAVDAAAATYRRASLAGLPLLALYTVPASILDNGIAWPLFLLGAFGFIGLLIAEGQERLVRWGRPLVAGISAERASRVASSRVDTTPFGQIGRRIGAAVIGLAIIVPALLPITDGLLLGTSSGLFGGTGPGDGNPNRVRIDPWISMRRNFFDSPNVEIVRMYSQANPADLYLRMATLDVFDGIEWRPSQPIADSYDNGLPRPLGLGEAVSRQDAVTQATISDIFENYYLPVPYPLTSLEIDGSWRVERHSHNILSARGGANQVAGKRYVARSLVLSPTPQQLATAPAAPIDLRRYIELPDQLPAVVGELADEATAGATSDYDKALRLQAWFRDPANFTYSTERGREGNGLSAIETFLADRTGYCEQFAGTMAVMARWLGIPARVNVGFSAGARQDDGSISVTTKDAHAWPELYFEGAGWVRFEPTPFDATRGGPPSYVAADNAEEATSAPTTSPTDGPTSDPTGSGGASPTASGSACPLPRPELCEVPGDPRSPGGDSGGQTIQLILAIVGGLLVAGSVPALLRIGIRRRRWRLAGLDPGARANVAWLELLDSARDLGFDQQRADTPRQTAHRLIKDAKLRTRHQEPLLRLTNAIERARYALTPADDTSLQEDLAAVRSGLSTRRGRVWRIRAMLLPRSTWDVAHWVAERIADGLDAIDRAASWVSRRVLRTGRSEASG